MFEGLIVDLLNNYLGKYIQNLDRDNLRLGIFNGNAELCNLQLRPEALFELDLPIEVKAGYVGRIYLEIPWTSLFSSPVLCTLDDVYILAGPLTDRPYDAAKEEALDNARKRKRLELIEQGTTAAAAASTDDSNSQNQSFTQKLTTTIINNIQVTIQRVHVRYEDSVSREKASASDHSSSSSFACGLMLREISLQTTNSQWSPQHIDSTATIVHKLLQIHSFSVYWNPYLPEQALVRNKLHTSAWRSQLKTSINTHRIGEEDFEFFLRPISTSANLILNKDEQNQIPLLVANVMMEELEILFSRQQFLSVLSIYELFRMMAVNQRYRKYKKTLEVRGHYREWWIYAKTAICEEFIRPYSWSRIQEHRKKYRQYKDLYKKYLMRREEKLKNDLLNLEMKLDEANITIAREHAKLEIASESPTRVKKQKPTKSWFSWWWSRGGADESSDEEEEMIITPDASTTHNLPQWMNRLEKEEHEELFKNIGYDQNRSCQHSTEFISHKIVFNLQSCSGSLINYGKEVLKVSLTQLALNFDNRPESDGLRVCAKTENFIVEGVSVEHELVPIITSLISVYAPSVVTQVFSLEFDKNPPQVEADFAAKLNIQPVEVVYDEHAVTEIVAFFQVPHITTKDVKAIAQAGFDHFAQISRAGLQYAIEQHKTLHLSVNMRSPYVVIPEYGTLHRGGNVIILDFGKLKIESELQPKHVHLEECTMSEIESRLYDKFSVTVTEVKMLLADSGEDWHTAQTKPESEFHVLPNFGLQLAFFNTVKSEFKQLPKHKLEWKLSTLKINLSDEKLQMLGDFCKHIPMPHSNSMMGLDDSVDGHIEPTIPIMDEKEVQLPPTFKELLVLRRVVHRNSVLNRSDQKRISSQRSSVPIPESDHSGSSSLDCSDDETEDWTKNLDVKAVDDPTSLSNLVTIFARFTIAEIVLQVSKVEDKIETPYLMLRVDRVCFDSAFTTYGVVMQARLGGIQLVDKIHLGASGEYLELLGFKSEADLMSLVYRKVSADCPDFKAAYHSLVQGIVIKLSSLRVTLNREAVLFLNAFVQGLLQSIQGDLQTTLRKSNSTILSGPTNCEPYQPEMPSFIDRLTTQPDNGPTTTTQLHLVIKLNDLSVLLCDHDNDLIDVSIKDMEGRLIIMKRSCTVMQARLRDFSIDDLTESSLYPRILSLDDDNAFDLKRVTYHRVQTKSGLDQQTKSVDGSLRLRVGRIQGVFVYKLIGELQNFLQPFANPEIVESYKVAAQHAVYNKIQDMHDQGTRISIFLDVHAPTVLIPQHSESSNVIVIKLGDLRVTNSFEDSDVGQGVLQRWDHLCLSLEAVQIMRGKLNLNGNIEPVHTLVEPMNLSLDLKRALPPHRIDTHYDISGRLKNVRMQLTALDLRVLLSVLRDNLLEEFNSKAEPLDMADFGLPLSRSGGGGDVMRRSSVDTTTPVVEIEEPLLFAPEVMELVQSTRFSFDMEGATVLLFTEDDDPLAPSSPVHGDGDELASFAIDGVTFSGTVDNSGLVEVRLKLSQITMTDIRPHSNLAVKKLIRSGLSESRFYSSCPAPVIDVAYHRNPEGNRQIDINLDTIRINVCIQYLLTIFHFFAEPFSEFGRSSVTTPSKPRRKMSSGDVSLPQPTSENVLPPVSEALTIRARFKTLEVVLFADPTDKHSRVLVLKKNVSFDYSCLQERKSVNAKIRQLQIISCIYGKTSQTTSIELYPCDIELKCSKESSNTELKVSLKVNEVNLYISPATVHIFLDVVEILRQSAEQRKDVENEYKAMNTGLRFDLWNVQMISAEPWLNTTQDDKHECKRVRFSDGPPVETLSIEVKKMNVVFEIQEQKYYVPRLCIKTALTAKIYDWSKQVYGKVELPVEVLYYNDKLSVWEPLVEQVMEKEGAYRPWEVTVKLVRAESHPMSCTTVDVKLDKHDSVDGQIHEFWARHRARSEAESSESETDSETEMTVIKPKLNRVAPLTSHSSYDSMSRHSSIQGESDSEPEILNSISTQLHSLLSSDSSDGDLADEDGDAFEIVERPVFLTSRGPVSVIPESGDYDVVDGEVESSSLTSVECKGICTYVVINSRDQLLLNVNPVSMDVVTEIYEMLQKRGSSTVKQSVHDLPPFEVFNQLGIVVNMSVSSDQKVYEDAIHDVTLESPCEKTKQMFIDELDGVKLVDVDEDEIDGLMNLSKAIRDLTSQLIGITVRCSPTGNEDDEDNLIQNDGRRIGKEKMYIKVDGYNELCNISFKHASRQLIRLSPAKNDVEYCMICDVNIHHSRKVITLRSPLQIHNHLTIPVQVFCDADELQKQSTDVNASSRDDNPFVQIGCLDPDGTFALPLRIAYHCKLYVAPANMLYEKTCDAIRWQDFGSMKENHRFFSCQPQTPNNNVFYFKVQLEDDVLAKRPSSVPRPFLNGTLHLSPSVILHNLLPFNIHYSIEGSALSQLGPGDIIPLFTADLAKNPKLQLQIINYMSVDWTGSVELNSDLEEFKAINMEPDSNVEGQNKQMSLSIHMNQRLAMDLYVYSPYWIINKTALPIQIRGSRSEAVYENNDSLDPLLFRFKKHRRKKAKLRIYNSKWTRSFSLDTIGSSGVVICYDKERNRKYQFLLQIELSKLKLTKVVTVMPYFLVMNNTPFHLRYMEDNEQADLWMDFTPNECCPFWPATESPKMYVKYEESSVCSQHFPVDRAHKTVLRMEKGTALCVDVTVTEISIVVRVLPYQPGDIPARIDNLCEDVFLKLHQKKQSQVTLLSPNQSVLYTWDDPAAERTLMWNVYNRRKPSYPAFINKDGSGAVQLSIQTVRRSSVMWSSSRRSIYDDRKMKNDRSDTIQYDSSSDDDSDAEVGPKHVYLRQNTRTDKVIVYWVSYLDGIQRVLLLTQDERIAKRAIKMNEAEMATRAVFLSMNGLGISVMNDLREEVAYVSLNSGATVWQVEIKNRWKLLSIEIASWLEQHWLKDEFGKILLEDIVEADLDKMEMVKPYVGKLRRTFNPALWMQLKQSEHNTYAQLRIHWIQIDNQLSDAIFPTVLNPYRIPAYIIKKSGPKPCIELTVARRQVPEVNLDTFKYVKLLMQEFCINLDKGFVMSIYDLFVSRQTPQPESYLLGRDVNKAKMSLADKIKVNDSSRSTRSVYEFLHLSPIKMHVSLSLDGRAHLSASSCVDNGNASVTSDIVDFFLNSVGAKLIDVKDVELRMAYFEREGVMLNVQQLTDQIFSHYETQSLQQAYVLLLGLDVLGNPYGLVKDFTQGLGDFFYEPFLGVIQEPDKYAENLVQGIRSLLGHTVGGLAGSMSSFTRSIGKTLAYLSFDDEYKQMRQRRMEQQQQQPLNRLPQSLSVAGNSFAMGVYLGLSGVVLHPLKGTKEEGVEGFFKGIGKGLMGLITKPSGGAVDMVSMAFDGLRRSAEMGEDVVHRMRLPRYIHPQGLTPYSTYQSVGMKILHSVIKTNHEMDIYWAHAALTREEKSDVVLVTDRRVFLLKKCKSWGEWSVDWDLPLSSLTDQPLVLDGKLILRLKKSDVVETMSWKIREDKELVSSDEELLIWIQKKISKAMKLN